MRQVVFFLMGGLELVTAALLIYLGLQIPDRAVVDESFTSVSRVTDQAGEQVRLLRRQVDVVRRLELQPLTARFQAQTRAITGAMRVQSVDFEAVQSLRDALGDMASGVQGLTQTLDPAAIGKLSDGLEQLADFMDQKIVPAVRRIDQKRESPTFSEADIERLKNVSQALRQGRKGMDTTLARWPELRASLARMAKVLQTTQQQLDLAVRHRQEYEKAVQETIKVADTVASLLPLISEQLDDQLDEEDQTLVDLGHSLDQVHGELPHYAKLAQHLFLAGRILAWLVAAIVGLHGCYVIVSARMGSRFSV
jgi:uncharacterized phage infection (PIP) family protein YhgE